MNWWRTKKLCYFFQKTFLHCTLHCTAAAPVPRDRGAASKPAASQLLNPSPAYQQLSSQQVPSPALHRCSTGADQSLTAAPATPSLLTGQNFIFFQKKWCQNTQYGEKTWSKLKFFVPLKKNLHTAQKLPRAYVAGPPFRKAIQCRNVRDLELQEKSFFLCSF